MTDSAHRHACPIITQRCRMCAEQYGEAVSEEIRIPRAGKVNQRENSGSTNFSSPNRTHVDIEGIARFTVVILHFLVGKHREQELARGRVKKLLAITYPA